MIPVARKFFIWGAALGLGALGVVGTAQTPQPNPATDVATASPASDPENWRVVAPDNLLQLTLRNGTVLVELRPDFAPGHVEQIRSIVRNGHYDGLPFHRVIDEFMAQGGEVRSVYPSAEPYGQLEPEFEFRRNPQTAPLVSFEYAGAEFLTGYVDGFVVQSQNESIAPMMADGSVNSWVVHCEGVASMARADAPNSADTQFFLMRHPQTQLDRNYTAWGRVVAGLDVVRGIKSGPAETDGRMPPDQADRLLRAVILSDVPADERPRVYVQRTEAEQFREVLGGAPGQSGASPCARVNVSVVIEEPSRD